MSNQFQINSPEKSHIETYAFPLSFAQQRLWFLQCLYPDSSTYNIPTALRLRGGLNVPALQKSIDHLIERHEVLRTTFSMRAGEAVQIVHSTLPVSIATTDLRDIEPSRREETLHGLMQFDARQPFDLARGPLLRVKLIQIADDEHVLVLNLHHIVSDGWSMDVMFRELSVLYQGYCGEKPISLPDLPIQYADYSVWQRNWLQGANLDQQLAYWRKQLDGLSTLQLPFDRPRPAVQNYRGANQSLEIPPHLYEAIKNLSQREGATLFMILLAAFQTLLYRYCGQHDIVVGSPIAGRTRQETEGLIGFFVNTLVLRSDLSNNPPFRKLLARVRQVALEAYDHQDIPFEKLVEELHPERNPSISPLFQVMFVFQNNANRPLEFEELSVEPIRTDSQVAKFDLSLTLSEREGKLRASLNYNTDLFDASTIVRMLGHFQTLLEGIIANPDQPISQLPLLTGREKHQLLVGWNDTKTDFPKDKCIHQLFEEQVEKTPDAIAVVFEDQQLTYRELNQRANQLAYYLQKLGVGPEVLVGICLERSLDMIVGLLAILKADAAYVPLDPSYPKYRLEFMLHDANASILLTQKSLAELLPAANARLVFLDEVDRQAVTPDLNDQANLTAQLSPNHTAYVIYTSGSTGTPKGTLVSHYNVVRLFQATQAWFGFNPNDIWTLFHSYAFDFSVWEIWGALLHGGKLIIVPQEITRSPQEFAALLIRHQVTVLNQTPSAFRQLIPVLTGDNGHDPIALRYVIFGGEALELQSLNPWFDRFGEDPTKLINMYGITETTVHVTYRPITRADATSGAGSVIGKAIPDLRVYLLDPHQCLVPIGVAGEIYVGGAGVAKGYLGRNALTAERFIPDPFSEDPQAKLYRSGDLARWLPNGELEYLGRIDNQVKIRGFRIELGEIETLLTDYPSVQQAVVIAREDSPGDKRLAAYAVTFDRSTISTHDLRNFLQHKLPDYMVPSAFVYLDSLPLTANGKLDRKALPRPDYSRSELDDTFAAPRTPVQEILANIWCTVLKLDKVGIHDNFFDLGGHSLLATQVVSRINTSFQIDLPLRRLFESPTIAGIADSVQANMAIEKDSRSVRSIAPVSRNNNTPLSFAQERLWFLDRLDPDSPTYIVPAAFRLAGDLNLNALEQSLNEVVRRHEVLRTVFTTVNGNPVQRILPSLVIALTPVDLSQQPVNDREPALQLLLKNEALQPFDLSRGPLIRAQLLRLSPLDHVLALNLHHIVSDGWSMGVVMRELSVLYQSYCAGEPNPLPALPIQYADYSVWQRAWLQGETLDHQLAYWKTKLDGLSTLQLPTDHPRPAMQTYRGTSQSVELSPQLSQSLKGLSQREGVTLFMTLLAAFQTLLSRYCGQSDIAVGTPIAGRVRQETEGLIGFFVNTLVLRADLSNNPTFKELLRLSRETTLEAYTHQDLPFEKLVEELHPERNPSISPLFQVLFVFQNNADSSLELEGINAVPIRIASNIAKFDLSLTVSERDGALRASLNYNTDLFNSSTIERMVGHFQTLLEGIVADPDQPISELPLLTEPERHQLLFQWNDTKTDYPSDKCLHQLFEAQVKKTPDAVAIVFETQRVTYRELNIRANQLAHYLQTLGVGPEALVGICLERSIDMIVALLAILKAGGAYVPLDASNPKDRLGFVLEDTQVGIMLTDVVSLTNLPPTSARVICLDQDWEEIAIEPRDNPDNQATADNLAYVIYTSGTAGAPKGVMINHRSLVNYLCWLNESPLIQTVQSLPALTRATFDASLKQLFAPLLRGRQVWILSDELVNQPTALLDALTTRNRVGLNCVPSLWRALLDDLNQVRADAARNSLSALLLGGEQLDQQLMDRTFAAMPEIEIWNLYGPTEATANACTGMVTPHGPPAIGRPIANTQIYILDRQLQPVPIGVTGELHISGDGLARHYLNRPELSAEKFIANPFSTDPPSRLYKTGDLGRYRPDGNIEFLGRIDNQVKIRGFRIELGEIEAVLAQHPSIQQAVVLAREDTPGDKRLVAYVVATDYSTISVHDLRRFLQLKLPDYMVPSAFVFLDTLPLTPNGKLDRKALPAPDQSRPALDDAFAAPTTPVEEILANIWCTVLKLDKVGIHDNFFHLGGHSLLATQIVSRINSDFGIELPLRHIFESPTVAEIAIILSGKQANQTSQAALAQMIHDVEAMTDEEVQKTITESSMRD